MVESFSQTQYVLGDTTFKDCREERGGEGSPALAAHRDLRPPARPQIGRRAGGGVFFQLAKKSEGDDPKVFEAKIQIVVIFTWVLSFVV